MGLDIILERRKIELPIGGQEVEIVESDGLADKFLYGSNIDDITQKLIRFYMMQTATIAGKKPTEEEFKKLKVYDQQFLAVNIWRLCYGDTLRLKGACVECGMPLNFPVPLDALPFTPLPPDLAQGDPTWEITTSRTKTRFTLQYITVEDELMETGAENLDPNRIDFKNIRAINGKKDFSYEDVLHFPGRDHLEIRESIVEHKCGYDPFVRARCTHCRKAQVINILLDPMFVLTGLSALR